MSGLKFEFKGVIAPVMTPFNDDRERTLNVEIIPNYAQYLSKGGIHGVLVGGTSGEGPSMSTSERKLLAEVWAKAVKPTKQHLMVQIGGAPCPDVIQLAKHAENIGVDSLLCLPDLYFKPNSVQELTDYLKLVGEAAPETPLFYYHIPMMTNVDIKMKDFLEFAADKIPTLMGIKYTSGDLVDAAQALHVDNKKYTIFLGCDMLIVPGLALGMDSFILAGANFFPTLIDQILILIQSGKYETAREYQEKFTKFMTSIFKHGKLVETIKLAMNISTDIHVGPPRAPLKSLSKDIETEMAKDLEKMTNLRTELFVKKYL